MIGSSAPLSQPLIQTDGAGRFALCNNSIAYVVQITPEGLLQHLYFGAALSEPLSVPDRHHRTVRHCVVEAPKGKASKGKAAQGGALNLSDLPQDYPTFGSSDFRQPALHARSASGDSGFRLVYARHAIIDGKPDLNGLPSARGSDAKTLILTMEDQVQGLEVDLQYSIWPGFGAITRSAVIRNISEDPIQLDRTASTAFDLPPGDYEALHLWGTWSREMNLERVPLPRGRFQIDSPRGTSSAAHNPFLAIAERGATETAGDVFATTLLYSGNHQFSVETGEFGDVRLLAGINPFNGGWRLGSGEAFTTPEALHVFSDAGLGAMSHRFHDFIRAKILPERFRQAPRPTYLNSWESAYFDVTEESVLALADRAVDLGLDMLVLDDGWFVGREDDTSSLGDWRADPTRFPSGIPSLAKRVRAKGLIFGLWFEPEMVSPRSQLFEDHPDWIIGDPERERCLGRNQLTLDLSQPAVQDHVFNSLDRHLCCGDIGYVKWDMNRAMTDLVSTALPPDRQGELSHRYILGLYKVLDRITSAYPDVMFENCASGGNRMDLGMLSYFAQTWTSDLCDPIGRLDIINGASLYLPLDALAAYVGPSPNHQNGRVAPFQTRVLAGAFNASRGLSLSPAELSENEAVVRHWMGWAKDTAPHMLGGRFDRLLKNENEVCWQYSAVDGAQVWLTYFHILSQPNAPFRHVRLRGLDPDALYTCTGSASAEPLNYQGDALMSAGLPMPLVSVAQETPGLRYMAKGDFAAALINLRRVSA